MVNVGDARIAKSFIGFRGMLTDRCAAIKKLQMESEIIQAYLDVISHAVVYDLPEYKQSVETILSIIRSPTLLGTKLTYMEILVHLPGNLNHLNIEFIIEAMAYRKLIKSEDSEK